MNADRPTRPPRVGQPRPPRHGPPRHRFHPSPRCQDDQSSVPRCWTAQPGASTEMRILESGWGGICAGVGRDGWARLADHVGGRRGPVGVHGASVGRCPGPGMGGKDPVIGWHVRVGARRHRRHGGEVRSAAAVDGCPLVRHAMAETGGGRQRRDGGRATGVVRTDGLDGRWGVRTALAGERGGVAG